eukprot:356232-Chlamydomonas_euryale.AAC.15
MPPALQDALAAWCHCMCAWLCVPALCREQLVAGSAQAQAAEDAEHGEGAAGVYRPPKINPVSMEG